MEEQVNTTTPLAVTHLLQHTLRSLCVHDNSQWVYAVFWRILPRNYPPPKWDSQGGAYDRSRGNRRNWILVWEDGFCNFAASTAAEITTGCGGDCPPGSSSVDGNCEYQHYQGLQPELFFKMSHEIYNYGEGLIGKVAADHGHKWIYKEPNDQEINFFSAWQNSADSHPRTWEAQFQSGIKTIALIAVREGVVQLGAVHKVIEDLSYVVLLRKNFSYIESIPGVLLPHPSSSSSPSSSTFSSPFKIDGSYSYGTPEHQAWHFQGNLAPPPPPVEFYDHFNQPMRITPSMSSLEALLSKLPSVIMPPPPSPLTPAIYCEAEPAPYLSSSNRPNPLELMGMEKVAKQEIDDDDHEEKYRHEKDLVGESSSSMSSYPPHHHQQHQYFNYHHHDMNVSSRENNSGF
ncbi:protein RICE SALT SENSITIVE 3-like isoform X2 [Camellia sinensis]|uniref:protein RICE SALT SENSITIVE 3-like isoform X2 n=1 Tax=Camellia sinensis TaxID=4442 RepID=UPI001035853A|nr:protein RICE SALT SENSITIVE 3-like isoform X2 [Camellia sinensis]